MSLLLNKTVKRLFVPSLQADFSLKEKKIRYIYCSFFDIQVETGGFNTSNSSLTSF